MIKDKEEQEITKEYMTELMRENEISVTFIKVDGTERTMRCTLKKDLLPEPPVLTEGEEPKKKRKVSDEVLAVWDLESEGFRSFRIDSIKSFGFSI